MKRAAVFRYSVLSPLFYVNFALAIAYGLNARSNTPNGGFWDVVVLVHLSSSVFAFVILPLWLTFVIIHNRWLERSEFLVRHGSFLNAWGAGLRDAAAHWIAFTCSWVFGLYISAFGLRVSPALSSDVFVSTAADRGLHPIWLLAGQVALETGFALTIAAILRALDFSRKPLMWQLAIAGATFAWFAIGASGALADDTPYDIARYVQVRLILTNTSEAVLALLVEIAVVVIAALSVRARDNAVVLGSTSRWVNLLTIHWALSALLITLQLCQHLAFPLEKSAISALSGNAGSAIDALTLSFIYCGACATLVIAKMPTSPDLLDLEFLRAGSKLAWIVHIFRRDALPLSLFCATVPLPSVFVYFMLGGHGPLNSAESLLVVWALLVNSSLHSWLLLGTTVIGIMIYRSANGAFGAIAISFVLTSIPQAPTTWWPFGAANLARVEAGAGAVFLGCASIAAAAVLVWFASVVAAAMHGPRWHTEKGGVSSAQ